MELTIRIVQLILSMSLLIILHELGHFLPARLFGTRIEKFMLFFDWDFSLFKAKKINGKWQTKIFAKNLPDTVKAKNDSGKTIDVPIDAESLPETDWRKHKECTTWGIGWIPLGGYVKIAGMLDESLDKNELNQAPKPWEFRSKPAWQRLIIMIGGVTVNLILGFAIFTAIAAVWGKDVISAENLRGKIHVSEKLLPIGFNKGDVPYATNGKTLDNPLEINRLLLLRDVKTVGVLREDGSKAEVAVPEDIGMYIWKNGLREQAFSLKNNSTVVDTVMANSLAQKAGIKKGDKITKIDGKPVESFNDIMERLHYSQQGPLLIQYISNGEEKMATVLLDEEKKLGIAAKPDLSSLSKSFTHKELNLGESLEEGVHNGYYLVRDFITQFKYVFTAKGATQMGGFGTIAKLFPTSWDGHQFWLTTGLISIMLAVMNLLPIPALDGGHILFLLYEMITRRKPSEKFLEVAQIAGMIILFGLMLYANGMDIIRAIKN